MKKNKTDQTYHDAMAQLQLLVSEIEADTLQLDELADKVKKAKELIAYCEKKLRGITEQLA